MIWKVCFNQPREDCHAGGGDGRYDAALDERSTCDSTWIYFWVHGIFGAIFVSIYRTVIKARARGAATRPTLDRRTLGTRKETLIGH